MRFIWNRAARTCKRSGTGIVWQKITATVAWPVVPNCGTISSIWPATNVRTWPLGKIIRSSPTQAGTGFRSDDFGTLRDATFAPCRCKCETVLSGVVYIPTRAAACGVHADSGTSSGPPPPQAAARCALSGTNSEFIVQKIQNYKIGPQLRPAKARYSRPAGPLLRALRRLRPAFHLEF